MHWSIRGQNLSDEPFYIYILLLILLSRIDVRVSRETWWNKLIKVYSCRACVKKMYFPFFFALASNNVWMHHCVRSTFVYMLHQWLHVYWNTIGLIRSIVPISLDNSRYTLVNRLVSHSLLIDSLIIDKERKRANNKREKITMFYCRDVLPTWDCARGDIILLRCLLKKQ